MHSFQKLARIAPIVFGALAIAACDNPAKDKAQATVSAPVDTPKGAAVTAGAVEYTVSPPSSKVEWEASKVTKTHTGSFAKFNGSIKLIGDGKPESAKILITIDTPSIASDTEKLTGHLNTPDLLDTAKFPTATFESTSITPGGANGATHTITGNLELHGVKKSITFPATVTVDATHATAKAEFVLKRKDFGIVYPGMPNDLIREDVIIRLTIDAPKKG